MVLVGLPLQVVLDRRSVAWLLLTSVVGLWLARLVRRLIISSATRSLARGEYRKARHRYLFLRLTAIPRIARLSCELSLAACNAAEEEFETCLDRLARCEVPPTEESLQAVALNLRAYCYARSRQSLDEALKLAQRCVAIRPHVAGFRHTRGLLLLELGRHEGDPRLGSDVGRGAGHPAFRIGTLLRSRAPLVATRSRRLCTRLLCARTACISRRAMGTQG